MRFFRLSLPLVFLFAGSALAQTITGISPNYSGSSSSNFVSITGTGFSTATNGTRFVNGSNVDVFNSVSCSSSTSCTANAPAINVADASASVLSVFVLVGAARSSGSQTFTYYGKPVITNLVPNSGASSATTPLTVNGGTFTSSASGFPGITEILLFDKDSTFLTGCGSTNACSYTTPNITHDVTANGCDGGYTLNLFTPGGTATSVFTYGTPPPAPTVDAISPNHGSPKGGTVVSITGTNFTSVQTKGVKIGVRFDTVNGGSAFATGVNCPTTTSCTATAPAGVGKADIRVFAGCSPVPPSSPNTTVDDFVYLYPRGDLNGDKKSDLVWRNISTGSDYAWTMNGATVTSASPMTDVADTNWKIVASGDFDGDGKTDLFWRRDLTGETYIWLMNGAAIASAAPGPTIADANWKVVAAGDFNGDGITDLFWRRDGTGENYMWQMNGINLPYSFSMPTVAGSTWKVVGSGDFDGDGKADLFWRQDGTGLNYVWLLNGGSVTALATTSVTDTNWKVVAVGDFNLDGKADLFWRRDGTGDDYIWFMNGAAIGSSSPATAVADNNWKVVGVGDFDDDGKTDLFWRRDFTGDNYIWFMNGAAIASAVPPSLAVSDTNWTVVSPK